MAAPSAAHTGWAPPTTELDPTPAASEPEWSPPAGELHDISSTSSPPRQEPTLLEKNERVAGLGARAVTEGAGDVVDTMAKAGHAIKDLPQWASWEMLKHMR